SLEQIQALWRNQTNIIVAQETNRFQNWTVQATPNDGLDDGVMLFNNISILNAKPVISPLILNSTNPKANHTGTHLLAYPNSSDADNDSIKVIYNWLRNDTPIALLNMPFEKINGTDTDNAWDYSGYGHNGSVVGATWNASGGYDGKGAYMFDDSGDYVELTAHLSRLEGLSAGTISLWYRSNDTNTNGDYLLSITDKDVSTDVMIFSVGASTGAYTDEGLNFVNIRGGATVLSMFVREGETAYKNQQWHHLAVVTGDGDNRMYINGARKPITFGAGSATTKEFSNINNPDSSFIGRYHVGGTAFDSAGRRDDVLFFNRSLSEEQIVALYNNRTDKIVSRELRVGENWTIEATPNDGYEDGAMVTSKNVTILANTVPSISSLILNTTNTSSNKTEVNLTAYVGYTDSNNDSVKIIYNWLRDGTPMTFLNMPFERINDTNTNNAKDYSFNSNNGTPSGATWIEDAGYDSKGAYKFDGVNDYIASVGNVSDFTFMQNTGNFTIEAWIKFDDYTANSLQVIAGNTPTTAEKGFLFTYENRTGNLGHNHLTLALYRGVAATYTVLANSSDFKIIDNNWHHVAAVGNYTNVLFYVDGVYDTGSKGEIINLPTGNANRVLDLGRYNGATPAGYFNGTIDELRIWNHTLPAEQIFAIFNNRTNIIVSNLTTAGENWTVDATPNDGVDDGATVRSNQVIISSGANTLPPAPVLLTPPTANITTNRTPAFTWNNSVDADGNTVTYRLEIDDNPAFNNLEVNVSDIANTTADNTTYLITTELAVDTTYFWKVFAYDGTEFGTNSTVFNFTLQSFLAIDIINNAVAFGTLNNGQNVSTPANANPFRAENSGNIVANVTLTATPLFGMVSLNQPFFAFNITANETGAFNYTQSSTNWTFFNSSSPFPHVWNLDWHLASNDFITHVNVSVPGNESGGLKSSTVTFTIQS
ncbi:LamG domain-containing protein, partial [Candidatus Woesearchaeota archaeon]|nr:LamG domain-containing protein [Candidatus Woesearchaeota archaeon]